MASDEPGAFQGAVFHRPLGWWLVAHHPRCRTFPSLEAAVTAIVAMQMGERARLEREPRTQRPALSLAFPSATGARTLIRRSDMVPQAAWSSMMNLRRGLFRLWIMGAALFVIAVASISYPGIKAVRRRREQAGSRREQAGSGKVNGPCRVSATVSSI